MTLQEIFALLSKAGQGGNQLSPNTPISEVMNGAQTAVVSDEAASVRPRMLGTEPPPDSLPTTFVKATPLTDPQPTAAVPTAMAQATAAGAPNTSGDQSVTYPPLDNRPLSAQEREQYLRQYGKYPSETPRDAQRPTTAQGPGILSKVGGYLNDQFRFTDPDFLSRLGNGLAVAGSQDPFKALMMLRQQQAEAEKNRQARIKAMNGETKPLGTEGVMVEYNPNGTVKRTYIDPVAAKAAAEARQQKFRYDVDKAVAVQTTADKLKGGQAADKAAIEDIPESANSNKTIQSLRGMMAELGSYDENGNFVKKSDNLTGPAVGFGQKVPILGPLLLEKSIDLKERVGKITIAGLRAEMGAQFTQKEGEDYVKRGYNENLDEETNYKRLQGQVKGLEYIKANKKAALEYYQKNKTLNGFVPPEILDGDTQPQAGSNQTAPAATQRNAVIEAQLKAANKPYDPNTYDYRIGPNGEVQSRKK